MSDFLKRFMEAVNPYREESRVRGRRGSITIVRNVRNGERVMLFNGITYSRMPGRSAFTGSYWDMFMPLGGMFPEARLLMIGLGGGTVAYQMERLFPRSRLETVEIDPEMVEMARRFYPGMKSKVTIADGAEFVKDRRSEYDVIMLDAYNDLNIPEVFLGDEFVRDAFSAMKGKGVLAINYAQASLKAEELRGYMGRLSVLFNVHSLMVGGMSDNIIIVCGKGLGKREILAMAGKCMPKGKESRRIMGAYASMAAVP